MTLALQVHEQAQALLTADAPIGEIALGIILGLLGWPLYAGVVRIAGALVGLSGAIAAILLINEFQPFGDWLVPALVIGAILGALLGLWLIRGLVLIVWLLMGASLGVLSVWALEYQLVDMGLSELSPAAQAVVWGGAALLAGLLMLFMRRWLVMGVTSGLGAALIAPHMAAIGPPTLAWWAAGTVCFFAIQVGLHRTIGLAEDQRDEEDDDE